MCGNIFWHLVNVIRVRLEKQKDDVIAYHFRQSFKPGEISAKEANRLGMEFAKRFTKGNHAFIVCTHTDKAHIHNHIIWSAVNIDCDRKFRNFWGSTKAVRQLSDTICIENGYSIVENPAKHGKSYNKWLGDSAPLSHREQLRILIDSLLEQKPHNLDELLRLLQEAGCKVSRRGNSITLQLSGWKRAIRMSSLGEGYTATDLIAMISGQKSHTPRKTHYNDQPDHTVNLLVDIQTKLQQGKGAGYERWAKIFNLKQMAKTMNYLSEHNMLSYAELSEKNDSATDRYNVLAGEIKAAEARMAELSVLRRHIINYVKTREVYVTYRKSGYSKRFLDAHESDLMLHKAAKKAFEELGYGQGKKLPTVKSIQIEYAELLEKKKKTYSEYRKARDDMKALQTVKHNVDWIMNNPDLDQTEKSHTER